MSPVPKILVVEDEAHIARLLQFVLARNGFEVATAQSGATALEVVRSSPPAAVILDLNLPDMSGTEVLAQIRQDPKANTAAVIILSAHAFDYGLDLALLDGRTVRCAKPVAPSRLLECLADFGLTAPVAKAG